ncbi:MAG: hypothetical protein IT185_07455 [Acidobacteria bacterium]|jgi:hypothetical protein|nr:hypothetical protein [Acidobacteriota bacterium]
MKSFMSALAVCLVAGAVSVWAQQQQQQQPPPQTERPEITVTGCLTQGSMPSVFILDNAKPAAATTGTTQQTSTRYLVIAEGKDVDLLKHINNEVQLRGAPEGVIPPPEKRDEKNLPRLRTTSLMLISNTCAN